MSRRLLLGAAAAGLLAPRSLRARKPLEPVKVGVLSSLSEAPLRLAQARGYFGDEGIDVAILAFPNTADMVAPLATGQLDVSSGAPTVGYFNSVLRGIPSKLVADKGRNSPGHGFNAIVVRKSLWESGAVKDVADLAGRKIASPSRWSPMEYNLDLALQQAGRTLSDVQIEIIPFPSMAAALSNGAVDAALLIEPFVAQATLKDVAIRLVGIDTVRPDFQAAAVLFSEGFARREAAAQSWMVGYLKGIRDYLDAIDGRGDRSALDRVLATEMGLADRAVIERVVFPGFDRDGYLDLESFSGSIEWFRAHGQLAETPKLEDIVDYRFLEAALDRVGRTGQRPKGETR